MIYKALDGERLDQIVYKYYRDLRYFEQVLELNFALEAVLKAGDKVILPEINEVSKKELKNLW